MGSTLPWGEIQDARNRKIECITKPLALAIHPWSHWNGSQKACGNDSCPARLIHIWAKNGREDGAEEGGPAPHRTAPSPATGWLPGCSVGLPSDAAGRPASRGERTRSRLTLSDVLGGSSCRPEEECRSCQRRSSRSCIESWKRRTNDDVTAWPVCRMTAEAGRGKDRWRDNQGRGGHCQFGCSVR